MDRNRDAQSWRSSILQNGSTEEHPRPLIGRPGSRRVKELRQPTVNSPVSLGVVELLLQSVNSSRSGLTVAGPQRQRLVHLLAETNQRLASLHAEALARHTNKDAKLHSKKSAGYDILCDHERYISHKWLS